jgi:hypothetical protein
MKLSRHEEAKLLTQGLAAVLLCVGLVAASFYIPHKKVQEIVAQNRSIETVNEGMHRDNNKVAKEITFLRENEKAIETLWATLRGWGNGVRLENIDPLVTVAGIDTYAAIPPTKIPGNNVEYAGMKIIGDKTEFQRMMTSLSEVESKQGLLQVRSAKFELPQDGEPNALRPTFLMMSLEIVAPASK